MKSSGWFNLYKKATQKRKRNDLDFNLSQEVYEEYSPFTKSLCRDCPDYTVLLLHLKMKIEQELGEVVLRDCSKKLCNPNQSNYNPLPAVYMLICEYLENPQRRIRNKLYSGLSEADHIFFMKSLVRKNSSDEQLKRFQLLMERVSHDQKAFHLHQQFRIITDPLQLKIYFQMDPEVTSKLLLWLEKCKMRVRQLPRFYHEIGSLPLTSSKQKDTPLVWLEDLDDLKDVPLFTKSAFLNISHKEELLKKEKGIFELLMDCPLDGYEGEIIIPESVLLAFLLLSAESENKSFEIPVEVLSPENGQKAFHFSDPLLPKELDVRQQQEIFFQEALISRYSIAPRNQKPKWMYSKFKFGPWTLLIRKRQDIVSSNELSFDLFPVKLFAKIEFFSRFSSEQKDCKFEVFSSRELAQYWLASTLHKNSEIQVAHLVAESGRKIKTTTFNTANDILNVLPPFLQFDPHMLYSILSHVLQHLDAQPSGSYLFQYHHQENVIMCLRANGCLEKKEFLRVKEYDLYEAYENAGRLCATRIPYIAQEWKPTTLKSKAHKIPHTFPFFPIKISDHKLLSSKKANFKEKEENLTLQLDYGEL